MIRSLTGAVSLGGDHGVEAGQHPEAFGEDADLPVLPDVLLHEGTVQLDGDPGVLSKAAPSRDRSREPGTLVTRSWAAGSEL